MNILQVKKCYLLFKVALQNKLSLLMLLQEKLQRNKTKAIENKEKCFCTFFDTNQKSIASLFSKKFLNEEARHELIKIVEIENKLNRDDLIYKTVNKKKDKTSDF